MLRVKQFRYGEDNLGYLVHGAREAVAIDPGEERLIKERSIRGYLRDNGLVLREIRNTHSHGDHTRGNRAVAEVTGAEVISPGGSGSFELEEEGIEVIPTPGHTADSVVFHHPGWVITGDTLFIANVGNCPTRRLKLFRQSLGRLLTLPEETVVYPGHDYTARSLERAGEIEPGNPDLEKFRRNYSPPPVASTIGDEKRINPYLRTDHPAVIACLKNQRKPVATAEERFRSFMSRE